MAPYNITCNCIADMAVMKRVLSGMARVPRRLLGLGSHVGKRVMLLGTKQQVDQVQRERSFFRELLSPS